MLSRSRRSFALGVLYLASLRGNWNDTSTGLDLVKLHSFPLVKLHSGWLQPGARVSFDEISAIAGGPIDRQVRLRGAGRQWEAHLVGIDEV